MNKYLEIAKLRSVLRSVKDVIEIMPAYLMEEYAKSLHFDIEQINRALSETVLKVETREQFKVELENLLKSQPKGSVAYFPKSDRGDHFAWIEGESIVGKMAGDFEPEYEWERFDLSEPYQIAEINEWLDCPIFCFLTEDATLNHSGDSSPRP